MKKLWSYLLLNVIVSAVTVLVVLSIWNAAHPCVNSTSGVATVPKATPSATLPPLDKPLFEVKALIGAGDLEFEHVNLAYLGSATLDMQGWTLWAGKTKIYTFPAFLLFKGGGLDLYSKAGVDTAIELYMDSKTTFWSGGTPLILQDPQGNVRLEYEVR
ncbi:MAG: hypothetical protein VB013_03225 [Anaerolineaceae bacterium]|nr:hypothetical protein [Anaerolineaceae bacterium]